MTPELLKATVSLLVGIVVSSFCFYLNTHTRRFLPLDLLTFSGIFIGLAFIAGGVWRYAEVIW